MNPIALRMIVLVLIANLSFDSGEKSGARTRTISGTVIAYNQLDRDFVATHVVNLQDLLVRVSKTSGAANQPLQYAKLRYRHSYDDPVLPDSMFDGMTLWAFDVHREPSCDQPAAELAHEDKSGTGMTSSRMKWTRDAYRRQLPTNLTIPCFVFEPGKYHRQPQQKK